ncbi:hypothetical protein [Alteromonas sp. KUL49]|uniref:hypothetical protein n=1 Tax=Alteromonas sp. KUL49 TaxID=2480798 RepID=UPI001A92FA9F|nr:hypothetical protein [Alteromonas sp. KUL49]
MKERQNSNDTNYHYAVAALIHYAKWMAENEYAYLDKPDILEFPNQTWSGQDIRKLCVLNFARAYVTEELLDTFDRKLESLEQKIIDRLSASDEAKTTRLLCLMMQNINYATYRYVPIPKVNKGNISVNSDKKTLLSLVTKTLASFSIGRERRQLVKRFPQLQKWLGQP